MGAIWLAHGHPARMVVTSIRAICLCVLVGASVNLPRALHADHDKAGMELVAVPSGAKADSGGIPTRRKFSEIYGGRSLEDMVYGQR